MDHTLKNLISELRRGTLVMNVLSQLDTKEYGYNLVQKLNNLGADVNAGTLYPLLRRLEQQGLLESIWDTSESRPRKYYVISLYGSQVYRALKKEWNNIVTSLENISDKENGL